MEQGAKASSPQKTSSITARKALGNHGYCIAELFIYSTKEYKPVSFAKVEVSDLQALNLLDAKLAKVSKGLNKKVLRKSHLQISFAFEGQATYTYAVSAPANSNDVRVFITAGEGFYNTWEPFSTLELNRCRPHEDGAPRLLINVDADDYYLAADFESSEKLEKAWELLTSGSPVSYQELTGLGFYND